MKTKRLVGKAEFRHRLGNTSESQFWKLREAGVIPAAVYLGPKSPRWPEEIVEAVIATVLAGGVATAEQAAAATVRKRSGRPRRARGAVPPVNENPGSPHNRVAGRSSNTGAKS